MKLGRVASRVSLLPMKMPKERTGGQQAKSVDKAAMAATISKNLARGRR